MTKLSEKAIRWLEESNEFSVVADDHLVTGNNGITILLSKRAVEDLNRQARDAEDG